MPPVRGRPSGRAHLNTLKDLQVSRGDRVGVLARHSLHAVATSRTAGPRCGPPLLPRTGLLERARSSGYRWVILGTNGDWDDAIAFYQACGFAEIGRAPGGVGFALDLRAIARRPGLLRRWPLLLVLLWRKLRPSTGSLRNR